MGVALYGVAQVRKTKLRSETEWRVWCKTKARPNDIPSTPDNVYKEQGWQGWGHWLGTGNVRTR